MGFEQVKVAGRYASGKSGTLGFKSFPYTGSISTNNANGRMTDLAAAATAISTGDKVLNGVIAMDIHGSLRAEDVPPEQSGLPPALYFSFIGFHSRAIRCARAISSGTILREISFIFIATLFRSAISDYVFLGKHITTVQPNPVLRLASTGHGSRRIGLYPGRHSRLFGHSA